MATGVQQADVWGAADALLQAGEQPTVERVRRHLGRGSPNTVGPHLKAWFGALGERLRPGHGEAAGLPDVVLQGATQLWQAAKTEAKAQWEVAATHEWESLKAEQAKLLVERAHVAQEYERLATREKDLETSVRVAVNQAAAAESRVERCEAQRLEVEQALRGADSRLSACQEQVQQAQLQVQEIRDRHLGELRAAEQRHAAHERRWLTEIDELRQAGKKAQDDMLRLRKSAEDAALEHEAAIQRAAAHAEELQQRVSQAELELSTLVVQHRAQLEATQSAHAQSRELIKRLSDQVDDWRNQVQIKDQQLEMLLKGGKRKGLGPRN